MSRKTISQPIRILIADQNQAYLYSMQNFIQNEKNLDLIDVCETINDLIFTLKTSKINVLIIDENIFQKNTITEIKNINRQYPEIKIVGLSIDDSIHMKEKMIGAGAHKYIFKWDIGRELINAINYN